MGGERPLVSIVTPSYNQARFLEETIRSVLDQDYPAVEYIVVDDGSSDDSVEVIRRYEDRLAWWTTQPNAGQVAAINRGFERSTGDLMGFLNSDDTLLPGALSAMVEALTADPELLLVYGDALYTDERSRETGYLPSRDFDVVQMVRACDNHVVQPSSLWRREAWQQAGPFDERAYYFFDFEFFLQLDPRRVKRLPKSLATYRIHPEAKSTGAQARRLAADHARLADEFFARGPLPAAARPHAREGRATAYLLASEFAYEGLELGLARRYVLTGLRLWPRRASPRWISLAAKTFLPSAVVARLRARRRLRGSRRRSR
jgi:glycosyltransferase involved in cell wall biosynthesis